MLKHYLRQIVESESPLVSQTNVYIEYVYLDAPPTRVLKKLATNALFAKSSQHRLHTTLQNLKTFW